MAIFESEVTIEDPSSREYHIKTLQRLNEDALVLTGRSAARLLREVRLGKLPRTTVANDLMAGLEGLISRSAPSMDTPEARRRALNNPDLLR